MNECESISVLQDGNCFVAIDPMKLQSETEEKEKLSHELGHCATGAFYNRYAACDIREKHERRANIWSIKKLVPKDELLKALDDCFCANRFELAEHFGVSEDFMQMALDYYLK
nr:MAG TPA: IrrE protein [Caudoviricetes sp.]